MSIAAAPEQYRNPAWGQSNPGWSQPPFWHPAGMSRPICIAATVLGFAFWWPVGLAMLAFGIASGRIGCRARRRAMEAQNQGNWQPSAPPWAGMGPQWKNWCGGGGGQPPSSGNHAFDDYRAETLRRLEDEQKDFTAFLERLRFAKDKAEFDQFMADRRQTPPAPPAEQDGPHRG